MRTEVFKKSKTVKKLENSLNQYEQYTQKILEPEGIFGESALLQ